MRLTGWVIGLALLLSAMIGFAIAEPLTQVAPGEPILMIHLTPGTLADNVNWDQTNIAKQIASAPFCEWVWAAIESNSQIHRPELILPIAQAMGQYVLHGEALLVIPDFQQISEFSPLLLMRMPDNDGLADLIRPAVQLAAANVPDSTTWDCQGYPVSEVALGEMPGKLNVAVTDDILAVSIGRTSIQRSLEFAAQHTGNSLAEDTVLEEIQRYFSGKPFIGMHLNVARLRELAQMLMPMFAPGLPHPQIASTVIEWLGIVSNTSMWLGIDEHGLASYSRLGLNPHASSQNWLSMWQPEPQQFGSMQFVPVDAVQYSATNLYNLPTIWPMIQEAAAKFPPLQQQLPQALAQFEQMTGLSVDEDVFGWMGSEMGVIMGKPFVPQPDTGQFAPSEVALFVQVADAEHAKRSFDKLAEMAIMMMGQGVEGPELSVDTYREATVYSVSVPVPELHPALAITSEYVWLSPKVDFLKRLLDVRAGEIESVRSNPRFIKATHDIPERLNGLTFVDLPRYIEFYVQQIQQQISQQTSSASTDNRYEAILASQATQLIEMLTPAIGASIETVIAQDHAIHTHGFMSIQDLPTVTPIEESDEVKFARLLSMAELYQESGNHARAYDCSEQALQLQPNHWKALMNHAEILKSQGNLREAKQVLGRTGFVTESFWQIIGPFDNTDGSGYDRIYPPEESVDLAAELEGVDGIVKWQVAPGNDGLLELSEAYGEKPWVLAYAYTEVYSEQEREVMLRIGSDDDAKIWLNGQLVFEFRGGRAAEPDQDSVLVTLQPGSNRILAKVCNQQFKWALYLRLTDAEGNSVLDVSDPDQLRVMSE